jgi:hypothetical protein
MKTQLEQLKQELREFIELSKTILGEKWYYWDQESNDFIATGENEGKLICSLAALTSRPKEFTFIARSRNISPAMAECLLGAIEYIENDAEIFAENCQRGYASRSQLQQILNLWEASK